MSSDEENNLSADENDLDLVEELENVNQPVQENVENENVNEDEEQNQNDTADENKKETKVKKVRNPQPKLDVERLRGPRGVLMLTKVFEEVKFKGKGYEEEDLGVLMKNYEYWCHRLFPRFPFDDCIEKIEKLGHKKYLQTFLKKIRMDMVDDFVQPREYINDERLENDSDEEDAFGNLVTIPSTETNTLDELTEEQLRRIELNREKAQRLRQEMLSKQKTDYLNTSSISGNNEVNDCDNSFQIEVGPEIHSNHDLEPSTSGIVNELNFIASQNSDIFNIVPEMNNNSFNNTSNTGVNNVDADEHNVSTSENTACNDYESQKLTVYTEINSSQNKLASEEIKAAFKYDGSNETNVITATSVSNKIQLNEGELANDLLVDFMNDDFEDAVSQVTFSQEKNEKGNINIGENDLAMDVDP